MIASSMIIGTELKDPYETFPIGADFGSWLKAGESIDRAASSVTAKVQGSGVDATAAVIDSGVQIWVETTILFAQVKGGVAGTTYLVEFKASTTGVSPARKWKAVVKLVVRDTSGA